MKVLRKLTVIYLAKSVVYFKATLACSVIQQSDFLMNVKLFLTYSYTSARLIFGDDAIAVRFGEHLLPRMSCQSSSPLCLLTWPY
jgi:hypothetical protein